MIQAVITDLAGTTIDFGSSAPAGAFTELFKRHGIHISQEQARGPMGLEKRAHIHAIASLQEIADQWRSRQGRDWSEADIDALYAEFIPLQLEVLPRYGEIIPGVAAAMARLKEQGIGVGATTGYNQAMMEVVLGCAASQNFVPDIACCAEEVSNGRPAPWMVYHCMEQLGCFPPASVVNIGDTLPDVVSGRNAGAWSVGVILTGNMLGLTYDEFNALDPTELKRRAQLGRAAMQAAGAHYVIDSFEQLPELVQSINQRIAQGEKP